MVILHALYDYLPFPFGFRAASTLSIVVGKSFESRPVARLQYLRGRILHGNGEGGKEIRKIWHIISVNLNKANLI